MSYEKVKGITFKKDFSSFNITCASNNVTPLDWGTHTIVRSNEESVFDFVKSLVADFISGGFKPLDSLRNDFLTTMYLKLEELGIERESELWVSKYDFNYKNNEFATPEDEQAYEQTRIRERKVIEDITNAFINNEYADKLKELKAEVYIIKCNYNYIKKVKPRGIGITSYEGVAQRFSGVDLLYLKKQYLFEGYEDCEFSIIKIESKS